MYKFLKITAFLLITFALPTVSQAQRTPAIATGDHIDLGHLNTWFSQYVNTSQGTITNGTVTGGTVQSELNGSTLNGININQSFIQTNLTTSQTFNSSLAFSKNGTVRISMYPTLPLDAAGTYTDAYTSPDSIQIGGLSGNLIAGTQTNTGSSLSLRGEPYGFYDTGTLLSLVTTERPLSSSRAGVNGGFESGPAAMGNYGGFDMVSLYNQTMAVPPRLVVQNVTYTNQRINFATPLTQAQIALLRRAMWINTNSYDPTISTVVKAVTSVVSNSGDASLSLSGNVAVAVGNLVCGVNIGINGMGTLVSSVAYNANANVTVVGLSNPLVDMQNVTSWPVGTTYSFETRKNSIGASVAILPNVQPSYITYASTITGWDVAGSWISVNGWTVPGSGHTASGQIPTSLLDPNSSYSTQTVLIGAPNKASEENWVSTYNPNDADAADSQINSYTGLELDEQNFATTDYSANFNGLTLVYQGIGQVKSGNFTHNVLPTPDSYGELIFGAGLPNLLELSGGAYANLINADSFMVHGVGGVSNTVAQQELSEFSEYVDGTDFDRLIMYQQKDTTGIGWATASVHLGLRVNGIKGTVSGGNAGELVFNNYNGTSVNNGGLALIGGTGKTGVSVSTTGQVSFPNAVIGPLITIGGNGLVAAPSGSSVFSYNCSNSGGEDCLIIPGDQGSTAGFSLYQETAANTAASAVKIFSVDKSGNLNSSGAATFNGNMTATGSAYVFGSATITQGEVLGVSPNGQAAFNLINAPITYTNYLWQVDKAGILQVAVDTNGTLLLGTGGTLNSDIAGDVVVGTQVSGGNVINTIPIRLAVFNLASLPTTHHAGNQLYCSDCRMPGQAAGAGTGMPVFDNGTNYYSTAGTLAAN